MNTTGESLHNIVLRINSLVSSDNIKDTIVRGEEIDIAYFVKDSYKIYHRHADILQAYVQLQEGK